MENHIKKVLITQNGLKPFAGSEIVTLELATFLKQNGIDVTVFTWYYSDPIKAEFEKRRINVITDENSSKLKEHFDLIWVNHQVLPLEIVRNINKAPQPIFIFYHMSYLDNLYIEQPYIYDLEKNLSSSSLFVSDETLELNLTKYGHIFPRPTIFPNWSPDEFLNSVKTPPNTNKILIVSNHPPTELSEATDLLKESGLTVEYIGHTKKKYDLVTPDLLKQYSCIISIGKTVQYCLTLNIPIYIYDHFGGCGFLNSQNYQKAKSRNFSGRGFNKKSPETIAAEITNKLNTARSFQTDNLEKFKNEFSLRNNFQTLLSSVSKQHKTIKLKEPYLNYVVGAETIAKQKIVAENESRVLQEKLDSKMYNMHATIDSLEKENQNLKTIIKSMENSRITKIDKKIRSFLHKKNKA